MTDRPREPAAPTASWPGDLALATFDTFDTHDGWRTEERSGARFGVLGQLQVFEAGTTLDLGGRRQQLVLAVLLDRVNERVSLDRLTDAVWGEAPPPTARRTLQAYVSRLRRLVGDGTIETIADGYRLEAGPGELDALRFEAIATEGERLLAEAPDRAAIRLRDALGLWRGSPYGSLGDELALRTSVVRLLERRLEVLEHRIEADLAAGNETGIAAELEALVHDHPLREHLHRLKMLVLYRHGRQAAALEVASQLRERLADELGLEPSPAVQDLQQRILGQDPTLLAAVDRRTEVPSGRNSIPPTGDANRGGTARRASGEPRAEHETSVPNPYRGLRPFTEDDAALFFGRTGMVDDLLDRVVHEPLTVVVGPSGSGKSSLVRAGLLPAVRRSHPTWTVATMVPGAHPFAEFEAALLHAAPDAPPSLGGQLRGDELDVLRAVLRVIPDGGHLLLVVDQLEELFLLADGATRDRFAQALTEAVDDPHSRLTVVATLRADFLNRPLQHAAFGPLVEEHSVLVPPLSPAELEAATVRPAQRVDVDVAPELVAQLVADVASEPVALPLFQYTLTELFDTREGGPLTLSGYRRLGGLQGALASRADEITSALDDTGRLVARQLFLRLVTLGEGSEDTRRRARRRELDGLPLPSDVVEEVLRRFGDARLLAFDRDAVTGDATVEVAHEALLREWPLLRGWIDEARADLRLHRSLALAAAEWQANDRDDGFLLTGSRLAIFDEWRGRGLVEVTVAERRFLEASRDHAAAQQAAEETRRAHEVELERNASRRLRQLVAVLAVAAVVAGGLGIVATDRASDLAVAVDAADAARENEVVARRLTLARGLLAEAQNLVTTQDELALLLALHAVQINDAVGEPLGAETVAFLHWLLQEARVAWPDDTPTMVVDTPTGRRGIFALPVDELVALARSNVDRPLTPAECERHFELVECPDPLPASLGQGIQGVQPTNLATADEPLAGTQVRIFGTTLDDGDPEADAVAAAIRDVTGGVEMVFDAEQLPEYILDSRLETDDIDLVILPQPSFIPALATNEEVPLQDISTWGPHQRTADLLRALGSVGPDGRWPGADGAVYGSPRDILVKGLVWYSRSAFDAAGYDPPSDYPGLEQLVQQMVADGRTPWCLGLEDGGFDGWPGTDIIENLVLHDLGTAGYDRWTRHELRFTDPAIRRAFQRYADLMLADGHLAGGRAAAEETEVFTAIQGAINGQLGCMMSLGMSRLSGRASDDAAWFPFPAITAAGEGTLLVGAGYVVALTDRPEVRAVIEAGTSGTNAIARIEAESFVIGPDQSIPYDELPLNARSQAIARDLQQAFADDRVRFDASDLMPQPVWRAFNAGMVAITREGPDAIDGVLAELDAIWDAELVED